MWARGRVIVSKLQALFAQGRAERALDEEMATHLALLAEKYEREGMSAREAVCAARRQFGNTTLLKQQQREARTTMVFAHLWRDVRYAGRQLAKTPVFTAVCAMTLALGVGANTAVFSVMHAVLMKMLPVRDASHVFYLHTTGWPDGASQTGEANTSFSYPVYRALREASGLEEVIAFVPLSFSGKAPVRAGGVPEEAAGDMVSGNYFQGLGVGTELGRGFVPRDEEDHAPVVVISDRFWATHYQRRKSVLGTTLFIKGFPFTIVGVAARGFEGTEGKLPLDFWIPLQSRPQFNAWGSSVEFGMYLTKQDLWCLKLIVRTAPGMDRDQALARAQTTFDRVAYLGVRPKRPGDDPLTLSFADAKQFDNQDDAFGRTLRTMMVMVGLVLLIAMSNVTMLLLARNASRQREFSVRLALGAGKRELARQLLTESLLLVALGGVAAWGLAVTATHALAVWAQIAADLQPDRTVLAFTLGVLFLLTFVFGLVPLRSAMRSGAETTLRSSATALQGTSESMRTGNAIIVAQIAMGITLLVGAGLLLGTLRNLLHLPLGQRTEGLLVFGVHPQQAHSKEESMAFFVSLQERLRAMAGVEDVSMATNRPGSGWSSNNSGFLIDGHRPKISEPEQASFRRNTVGANYFQTMGVPVLQGRDFRDSDSAAAPVVLVVNETFAKRYLGTMQAVGHVVSDTNGKDPGLIVGVVKDHKYTGVIEETMPMLWNDFEQGSAQSQLEFEVRVSGAPMALLPLVRQEVSRMDPDVPLLDPTTQTAVFAQSVAQQALFARLASCFGVLAIVLIASGLYGTLAYRVSRRSAEIGVRMALGAQRAQVVWMVLRGSLLLCVAGVALGVPLAMTAARGLESSLYGIKPLDVLSYVFAVGSVACVSLLSSAIPASRAAAVNPSRALRME